MSGKIKIAVDAMGGENSPKKVIDGIIENYKKNKDVIYNIFGDQEKINSHLPNNYNKEIFNITNTNNKILNGKATNIGESIIIPNDIKTDATTISITKNGKKSKKPIWKAVFNSEVIKAGNAMLKVISSFE